MMFSALLFALTLAVPALGFVLVPFDSYGSELEQATRIWNLTSSTFNESLFFLDFFGCYPKYSSNKRAQRACFSDVNAQYNPQVTLWTPKINTATNRAEPDCSYLLSQVQLANFVDKRVLEYEFRMTSNCTQTIPLPGGGTFEVFAHTKSFVTSCTVEDRRDHWTYAIFCRWSYAFAAKSSVQSLLSSPQDLCLFLTVILLFEHFDVYTQLSARVYLAPSSERKPYLPSRAILADSSKFCFLAVVDKFMSPSSSSSSLPALPKGLTVYSAVWQAPALFPKGHYSQNNTYFGNGSFHWASEHHAWKTGKPEASTPAPDLPILVVRFSGNSSEAINANERRGGNQGDEIIILGASHARYFFDALVEYHHGPSVHDGEHRKHLNAVVHSTRYITVELVDDLVDALLGACSPSSGRQKIVFHTGSHDLSITGPRRFVREEHSLPKLFAAVESIVFGSSEKCKNVSDIIWVLTAPYPVCGGALSECETYRFWRFNPAIAAANTPVLQFAHDLMSRAINSTASVKLKIIDFFSIIKPRLGLKESSEVTCLSHFIGRVQWEKTTSTVFTPGGKASFDALLDALA